MRLTVNLDPELYAIAKSLARSEDCSISAAVNRLMRRSLGVAKTTPARRKTRNGIIVSHGRTPVTADTVRRIETEDDAA